MKAAPRSMVIVYGKEKNLVITVLLEKYNGHVIIFQNVISFGSPGLSGLILYAHRKADHV